MLHQITTTNTAQTQCCTRITGNHTQISTKKARHAVLMISRAETARNRSTRARSRYMRAYRIRAGSGTHTERRTGRRSARHLRRITHDRKIKKRFGSVPDRYGTPPRIGTASGSRKTNFFFPFLQDRPGTPASVRTSPHTISARTPQRSPRSARLAGGPCFRLW